MAALDPSYSSSKGSPWCKHPNSLLEGEQVPDLSHSSMQREPQAHSKVSPVSLGCGTRHRDQSPHTGTLPIDQVPCSTPHFSQGAASCC